MRPCAAQIGIEQRVDRIRLLDVGDVSGGFQITGAKFGDQRIELALRSRPTSATCAPNRANSQTIARPMPPAPPDTITT